MRDTSRCFVNGFFLFHDKILTYKRGLEHWSVEMIVSRICKRICDWRCHNMVNHEEHLDLQADYLNFILFYTFVDSRTTFPLFLLLLLLPMSCLNKVSLIIFFSSAIINTGSKIDFIGVSKKSMKWDFVGFCWLAICSRSNETFLWNCRMNFCQKNELLSTSLYNTNSAWCTRLCFSLS